MPDPFATHTAGLSSPAEHAAAITPNDGADLANSTRAIYVGGAGNIRLDTVGGESSIDFVGVAAGTLLNVRAKRVRSTGTTATNLVGIW